MKEDKSIAAVTVEHNGETIIPIIVPSTKPLTRMELIQYKAEQLKTGDVTIFDVGRELKLTTKQIEFAKTYTDPNQQFGNGVHAACKAYDLDINDKLQKARAAVYATNNLKHSTIMTLVDILLDTEGLNDSYVDKQLLFLITQSADLKVKSLAIKEYNALKNRTKKHVEITHNNNFDFTKLGSEELKMLIDVASKTKLGNG